MKTPATKVISGLINSTPVIIQCSDWRISVRKNGTGNFTIRFPPDFKLAGLTISAVTGSPIIAIVAAVPAGNEATVALENTAGATVDNPFMFTATSAG